MAKADAITAHQLEEDAASNPDERTDLLFDAAAAWQRAGEPARAIELLTDLLALNGEPRCFARVCLADVYAETGDIDRMNAELDTLAREPDLDVGHCELVADMLVEYGDLKAAVRWYDRAVARMSAEAVDELGEPDSPGNSLTKGLVRRRRGARRRLGLEPDRLDELVDAQPTGRATNRTQFLMFQRDELPEAQRRWPSVFDEPAEEYYARGEHIYQEYRDAGLATIHLVSAKASDLAAFAATTGDSAEDGGVRARFAAAADPSAAITWPPERNASCWCGSARKYKKCCGRPGA